MVVRPTFTPSYLQFIVLKIVAFDHLQLRSEYKTSQIFFCNFGQSKMPRNIVQPGYPICSSRGKDNHLIKRKYDLGSNITSEKHIQVK